MGSVPPDRAPCPSRMSALEQSIRKYAEEPTKIAVRPELGLSFDSLGEAYDFYNLYSWEIGFRITDKVWQKQIERREDQINAGDRLRLLGEARGKKATKRRGQ